MQKKIHKIYLVLALTLGVLLSIFMPFFNEPDGQYHYVEATNIAGLSNDITKYGETSQWWGNQWQYEVPAYQSGSFFDKYYATEIKRVPVASLPRANVIPPKYTYNYLDHVIPAVGVWIGYHIYPSMGVMITFGRLFTMLICTIAMFFIIKYVKRGKLMFMAVSLSPVIMNTFSSLSYDAVSFILAALVIALSINAVVDKKATRPLFVKMLIVTLICIPAMKTNLLLLLLLFPIILFGFWWEKRNKSDKRIILKRGAVTTAAIIIGFLVIFVVSTQYGGFSTVIYRFFVNLLINFNTNLNTGGFDITSLLVTTLPFNSLPIWLTGVWFILIAIIPFSDEKFVDSPFITYGALGVFLLNVFSVYLSFMNFYQQPTVASTNGYIAGLQGRYFTPFLLLFPLFAGYSKFKLKINRYTTVVVATVIIVIISNIALLFSSLFSVLYTS